jgi:hypothetical protein
MLGTPLTSTEGVVALFAYACDTLSRPEGIIDHAVDHRRNRIRHGLMGEFCDARQLTSFCPSAARQWGGGSRFGRFAAAKGRFTVGRFPMRPWDGAAPIPSFRLPRFLGR